MPAIILLLLAFQGCETNVSTTKKKQKHKLRFSYFTTEQYKAVQAQPPATKRVVSTKKGDIGVKTTAIPEFGCFVDVKQDAHQWRYWSVALHYPDEIVKKADGKKVMVRLHTISQQSGRLVRLANCVVPWTPKAIDMVEKLGMKGLKNIHEVHSIQPSARLGDDDQGRITTTSTGVNPVLSSFSHDSGTECFGGFRNFNGGVFRCPPGACWISNSACRYMEGELAGMSVMPLLIEKGTADDGADSSGEPPGSDSGDDGGIYNPPPAGPPPGGSGPCRTCGPGDGGSGGLHPCTVGNTSERCQTDQPKPCESFDTLVKKVLNVEGGFTNDPTDAGGPTNHGITWATWQTYANQDLGIEPTLYNLKHLTVEQAKVIYKKEYWDKILADQINDGDLRYMLFDFYVNAGWHAIVRLEKTLNQLGVNIDTDRVITMNDIRKINDFRNQIVLYNKFKKNRKKYYHHITRIDVENYLEEHPSASDEEISQNTNKKYIDGWINRVNSFANKTQSDSTNVNCRN